MTSPDPLTKSQSRLGRAAAPDGIIPVLFILIVLLWAAFLRILDFNTWPPVLSQLEAANGLDAFRILQSGYFPDNSPDILTHLLQALSIGLFGPTRFGLRIVSFFAGMLTVAAAFRAGRHLAPKGSPARWRSGLLAAGALGVMIGHIELSRIADRSMLQPFAILMFMDTFVSAWEWRRTRDFALAGLWLAVSLFSYRAGVLLFPVIVVGFVHRVVFWLVDLPDSIERGTNLKGILIFIGIGVAGVVLLGMLSENSLAALDGLTFSGVLGGWWSLLELTLLNNRMLYVLLLMGAVGCVVRPRRLMGWMLLAYLLTASLSTTGERVAGIYAVVPLIIAASIQPVIWLDRQFRKRRYIGQVIEAGFVLFSSGALIFSALQAATIYTESPRHQSSAVEVSHRAIAEEIVAYDGVTYLPLELIARPSMRYATLDDYRRVTTFAAYFGEEFELPHGQIILPAAEREFTTFAAFMPDGMLVLMPRFDNATLASLQQAEATRGRPVYAVGEIDAWQVDYPAGDEPFAVMEMVPNHLNYGDRYWLVGSSAALTLPVEDKLPVTLYFSSGQARHRQDVNLITQLWTISREKLAASEGSILYRWLYPPEQWQSDDVVPVVVRQPVPAGLNPGAYHVAVGLTDLQGEPVPVLDAAGQPVADLVPVSVVKVPRPGTPSMDDVIRVDAIFSDRVKLLGYQVVDAATRQPISAASAGQAIVVRLYWQTLTRPKYDYTVFVHVENPSKELIAQNDSQPAGGQYPTGIWSPGEVVVTEHLIMLPEHQDGPFTLYTGWYRWPDLLHLPVLQDGRIPDDHRALLGRISDAP